MMATNPGSQHTTLMMGRHPSITARHDPYSHTSLTGASNLVLMEPHGPRVTVSELGLGDQQVGPHSNSCVMAAAATAMECQQPHVSTGLVVGPSGASQSQSQAHQQQVGGVMRGAVAGGCSSQVRGSGGSGASNQRRFAAQIAAAYVAQRQQCRASASGQGGHASGGHALQLQGGGGAQGVTGPLGRGAAGTAGVGPPVSTSSLSHLVSHSGLSHAQRAAALQALAKVNSRRLQRSNTASGGAWGGQVEEYLARRDAQFGPATLSPPRAGGSVATAVVGAVPAAAGGGASGLSAAGLLPPVSLVASPGGNSPLSSPWLSWQVAPGVADFGWPGVPPHEATEGVQPQGVMMGGGGFLRTSAGEEGMAGGTCQAGGLVRPLGGPDLAGVAMRDNAVFSPMTQPRGRTHSYDGAM